jgi:hypothetical protein
MPRRRSHGLTFGTIARGTSAAVFIIMVAGCQVGGLENGCHVRRQLVMPDSVPLALLSEAQIERVGDGFAVVGTDGATVRWTTIDGSGLFGAEQSFALPTDTVRAYYALAGVDKPGDRVIIGVLTAAANGTDAELHLVAAPTDGSPAGALGPALTSFGGGADPQTPPLLAMGTSVSGMYAGVAWIDATSGFPTYAFVDGQGAIVRGEPAVIENEPASGYSCLGFSPGKQELTVTYQRAPAPPLINPTWLIADIAADGAVSTLKLNVTQPGGFMGCARTVLYNPLTGEPPEYAIAWQDTTGSWLSVYSGLQTNMVKSYPFAASTDFGGADLQPPIMGLAAFGSDFGVLFARSSSVELWRVGRTGSLRSGALLLPSVRGDTSGVSAVSSPGLLTSTYADITGPGTGRRMVVDAVCY